MMALPPVTWLAWSIVTVGACAAVAWAAKRSQRFTMSRKGVFAAKTLVEDAEQKVSGLGPEAFIIAP